MTTKWLALCNEATRIGYAGENAGSVNVKAVFKDFDMLNSTERITFSDLVVTHGSDC